MDSDHPCSKCGDMFEMDELWVRMLTVSADDSAPFDELWCSDCYVPHMQQQLALMDGLVARHLSMLAEIGSQLKASEGFADNYIQQRCVQLIMQMIGATPPRAKATTAIVNILAARMNYSQQQQIQYLANVWEWEWDGNELSKIRDGIRITARSPVHALEVELADLVKGLLTIGVWDAMRATN